MARSGGQAAAKRAREQRREQRKEDKKERREALAAKDDNVPVEEQTALMEEFAALSARLENDEIDAVSFEQERRRIFVALGLEEEDE
jgi:phage I-like protein